MSAAELPVHDRALKRSGYASIPDPSLRTVRVGLLGLGQVGQAVARLAAAAPRLDGAGLRFRVDAALVRDADRPRACLLPQRLTTDAAAFLAGDYDVAIEALGGVGPARTMVAALLSRGVPVVTANKTLVAAHGVELFALAARHGTSLRYEASALAGVPFLGALAARPLVSDVQRFAAVVNGTSNFILSAIEADGCSFDEALAEAQRLGLTEPDPSRDLDGLDAADKTSLLATLFGWGPLPASSIDVQGIREISAADLAAARAMNATIKPLACAARTDGGLEAFVGPALVPARHPLASLSGTLNGIQLTGRYVQDLFFSGPGAGPDVTAATMLDDAVEVIRGQSLKCRVPRTASCVGAECGVPSAECGVPGDECGVPGAECGVLRASQTCCVPRAACGVPGAACCVRRGACRVRRAESETENPPLVAAPATGWFIRARFPGVAPGAFETARLFERHGLAVLQVSEVAGNCRWVRVNTTDAVPTGRVTTMLQATHRVGCFAIRAL